jgi:hypothetical protein
MPAPRWCANGIAFALSTGAKTAINLIAGAAERISCITEISVSIDTTAIVLVELCESTQAGAGTPGTTPTLKQVGGFSGIDGAAPVQVTAAGNYSAEPTVLTRLKAWRFTGPGPFVIQSPLGREVESLVSGATKYKALALRLTASVGTPACDSYIEFE